MSTIDPFAFGKGLQEGAQFNAPPDPLKQEELKANILDRQVKAQQLKIQTENLRQTMQERADAWNSQKALQTTLQNNSDASVAELYANGVRTPDVEALLKQRQTDLENKAKIATNQKTVTDWLTDAYEATGSSDPAALLPVHAEVMRKAAAAGLIPLDTAQKSIDSGQVDQVSALKAYSKNIDTELERQKKQAAKLKDDWDAHKAEADARKANAEAAAIEAGGSVNPDQKHREAMAWAQSPQAAPYLKSGLPVDPAYEQFLGDQNAKRTRETEALNQSAEDARATAARTQNKQFRDEDQARARNLKIDQDYDTLMNSYDNVQGMLKSAKAGNKVTNAAFEQIVVNEINRVAGVKRSNEPEMSRVGAAGGVPERIKAAIVGAKAGDKVAPGVIDDAISMFEGIKNNADAAKDQAHARVNQYYGQPGVTAPAGPPAPGYGPIETRTLKSGGTVRVRKNLSTGKYEEAQ